jgi:hypothetical protein
MFQQSCPYSCTINQSNLCCVPANPVRIPAQSTNQTYTVFQKSCLYSCAINQSNICIFQQTRLYSCKINQSNLCCVPAILSVFLCNQSIKQTYAYSAILSVFLQNQSIKPMPSSSNPVRIPAQSINQTYTVFQQSCPYSFTINQSNLCRLPASLSVFLHNQSIKHMTCSSNPIHTLCAIHQSNQCSVPAIQSVYLS